MNQTFEVATQVVHQLQEAGVSVAVAESLTGGMVASAITDVPGASAVFLGGAVTYATAAKHALLDVDDHLLRAGGPVQAQVAREMAHGVRRMFGADLGLATTGVAGPTPQSGQPVGRVFIAAGWSVDGQDRDEVRMLDLHGDRAAIRAVSVEQVLQLALQCLPLSGER